MTREENSTERSRISGFLPPVGLLSSSKVKLICAVVKSSRTRVGRYHTAESPTRGKRDRVGSASQISDRCLPCADRCERPPRPLRAAPLIARKPDDRRAPLLLTGYGHGHRKFPQGADGTRRPVGLLLSKSG